MDDPTDDRPAVPGGYDPLAAGVPGLERIPNEAMGQVLMNYYTGAKLGGGAQAMMRQIWISEGRPYGSLQAYIDAVVLAMGQAER